MKKQIVIIHGGYVLDIRDDFLTKFQEKKASIDDFKSGKGWKDDFEEEFANDFEVFRPIMPNKENAKYTAWKIWFDKLVPFLNDDITLIGHSLGGLFLTKYLSELIFPKKIKALILIAAPYNGEMSNHQINTDFTFNDNFKNITNQVESIFLFHSEEDKVVPFADFEIYKEKLPNATAVAFKDRGHFHNIKNFPELKEIIRKLYSY